jgi:glc operon protein GlcG
LHFISLLAARGIVDAAMAEADRRGISKAAAVVTDFGGDIRAALRADGAGALGFGISSLRLAAIFGPSASSTIGINAATGGRFVPIGGGVLVLNSQGHVIGAAAVSGGAPEVDDEIITLAVRAAGLQVQE